MAKKEKYFIKKFFVFLFFALNMIAALGLLFALLAQFISPNTSIVVAYCGLAFPYLMFTNLFFVFFWLFIKYRFAFISLALLLLNVNNIDKYFQFSGMDKPPVCDNCLKVMTYNAQLFGVYNSNNSKEREKDKNLIFDFLNQEQPDIMCFQEFFYDKSGKLEFNTLDSLVSMFKLDKRGKKDARNYYATHFPTNLREEYYYGLAIFSKYKIVNSGPVELPDTSSTNGALFADIKYKNDTVRVYCLHLESFKMDKFDYEVGRMLVNTELNDPELNAKAMKLSNKLTVAFKKRAIQADVIKKHIKESPYPVIICGDFNDTPASYAYNQIVSGFKDTFRSSGRNKGITYIGDAFPAYRIDNIAHHRRFSSYGHTVCTDLTVSDHYPVYTYISIKKR